MCSSWATTRKTNGDNLRGKVSHLIGSWRIGKFMPLSLRPHSVNTYALSKVWYRSSTVNLREGDYLAINSSIKKWLYSDLLFKPESLLLHRPVKNGGLGLVSVKLKCLANMIRNFVDLAVNPNYLHSQFLNILYRVKILDENISSPPSPPYYNDGFFNIIREAVRSGKEISRMKTKHWYHHLYHQEYSFVQNDELPPVPLPCKVEVLKPELDWNVIYSKIRIPALQSDVRSFGWKLIHRLLPSEDLLHNRLGNISDMCRFSCNQVASVEHCLLLCNLVNEVGFWILNLAQMSDPSAEISDIVCLNFNGSESLFWLVLNALSFVWSKRSKSKQAELADFLATIKQTLQVLSSTVHKNLAEEVLNTISEM